MKRCPIPLIIMIILLEFSMIGCQAGPSVPDTNPQPESTSSQSSPDVQVHNCLGYYSLILDIENSTSEIAPLRTGEWHFNLTGVLNTTMGVTAIVVPGESDPSTGLFALDITLAHPFATKPNLSGFDVKGILMAPGTLPVGSLIFSSLNESRLENADGLQEELGLLLMGTSREQIFREVIARNEELLSDMLLRSSGGSLDTERDAERLLDSRYHSPHAAQADGAEIPRLEEGITIETHHKVPVEGEEGMIDLEGRAGVPDVLLGVFRQESVVEGDRQTLQIELLAAQVKNIRAVLASG